MSKIFNPGAPAKEIAEGSYIGDETARDISVGFKCSLVIILDSATYHSIAFVIPDESTSITNVAHYGDELVLHATDGFTLESGSELFNMNVSGSVYYYWAISE